jgi:phosphatidylglycerol---prolipoprotein diacylglyceryl transferase
VHPILFELPFGGGFPVYSYGVMLGLSFVVGWYLTLGLAKRDGLPREPLANCYIITAVSAVAGARLLYVATNPAEFDSIGKVFEMRSGGMVAYGGFLGGFVGSLVYLRLKGIPLIPWADVAVPSLASGLLITRIGCYLFGCDFGRPLAEDAPGWLRSAGTFPHWPDDLMKGAGSPAFLHHVDTLGMDPTAPHSLPVHPTQLYEAAVGAALLGLLFFARSRQSFRGQIFFLFTFAYGVARFVLEFFRDDAERGDVPPSLPPHWLYALAFIGFAIAYSVGLARMIRGGPLRGLTQAVAFVPAVVLFVKLQPDAFATVPKIQLSTSQAVGLVTGVASMLAFAMFHRAALANPRGAMALPDFSRFEDDGQDEGEDEGEEASSDASPKPASDPRPKPAPKPAPEPARAATEDGAERDGAERDGAERDGTDGQRIERAEDEEPGPGPRKRPKKRRG